MIRVICRCSYSWEVPDDQAGLPAQCARCGMLLDVPGLGDVNSLEGDGTYKLDQPVQPAVNSHLHDLTRVYHPGRTLKDGTEIDLRGTRGSPPPIPLAAGPADPVPVDRPRYDPETGELIQPLGIGKGNEPPAIAPESIPVAHKVINYNVSREALEGSPHGWGVFTALFNPVNVIVMAILAFAHLFWMVSAIVGLAIYLFLPVPIVFLMTLLGHYSVVLEETGPNERDDLPRPLRNVNLYDDLFAPFVQITASLFLSYWPIATLLALNAQAAYAGSSLPFPHALYPLLACFLAGSVVFPAVFLTIVTSDNVLNLRPDRVFSIIRRLSPRYFLLSILWALAAGCYLMGLLGMLLNFASLFTPGVGGQLLSHGYVAYPLLLAGIYLGHAFCWLLGLEYRCFNHEFAWTAQVHHRLPTAVAAPKVHPKLAAAEEKARERAARRPRPEIR
jgi:hypothetical protein